MLKLYNTLTRKKEEFVSIKKGKVGVYSCGPTVYWFAHIGNMRAFLLADILVRTLNYNGFNTELIMNITDVGHLTDDASDGEDKMIVAMKREGKTAYDIAEFYTDMFFRDADLLNIRRADKYPKATEHIQEQIDMIGKLEKNGFTYQTSGAVYFDTSNLSDYGVLSGQKAEEKQAGLRVDMGEKKSVTDFALWKLSQEDQNRDMEWESPWGIGFPGWHIECSAMSAKYLGLPFDIHTGGVDHIAVHHENEIAQTRGAENVLQANVWMHSEFLTVENGKMSKPLGNLYTIEDLINKGYDPVSYRYFVLGAHYRTRLNFTFEALDSAQTALRKIRSIVRDWDKPKGSCADFEDEFLKAINEDLNTPQALAVMWKLIDSDNSSSAKAQALLKFDEVLGLKLYEYVSIPLKIPEEVQVLLKDRDEARKEKNWEVSDSIRDEILEKGFVVEDTDDGQKLHEK